MKEKLETLKKLLAQNPELPTVLLPREEVEDILRLAETVFDSEVAGDIVERFDAVVQRYQRTLAQQVGSINALFGRLQAGIAILDKLYIEADRMPAADVARLHQGLQKLKGQ